VNTNILMLLLLSSPLIVVVALFSANRTASGRSWSGQWRAGLKACQQALRDMHTEWIAIMGLALIVAIADYFVTADHFTLPPESVPDWPALAVWEYWVLLRAAAVLSLLAAIPYVGLLTYLHGRQAATWRGAWQQPSQ
jgi:hypothetical protein